MPPRRSSILPSTTNRFQLALPNASLLTTRSKTTASTTYFHGGGTNTSSKSQPRQQSGKYRNQEYGKAARQRLAPTMATRARKGTSRSYALIAKFHPAITASMLKPNPDIVGGRSRYGSLRMQTTY